MLQLVITYLIMFLTFNKAFETFKKYPPLVSIFCITIYFVVVYVYIAPIFLQLANQILEFIIN